MPMLSEILHRLQNVRRTARGRAARCPSHDDQHNSLSISEGHDGRMLVFCHANAGCTYASIMEALGVLPKPVHQSTRRGEGDYRPDSEANVIYDYRDKQGDLLYQVLRFDSPKDFRPRISDGHGSYRRGLPRDIPRVLYRLQDILESDPQTTIFIVEGEKDVESLRGRGLVATCNVGGAGKWRDEYNEALCGRHVCILPDHDRAGIDHALKVARSLYGVAASVRIVDLFAMTTEEG